MVFKNFLTFQSHLATCRILIGKGRNSIICSVRIICTICIFLFNCFLDIQISLAIICDLGCDAVFLCRIATHISGCRTRLLSQNIGIGFIFILGYRIRNCKSNLTAIIRCCRNIFFRFTNKLIQIKLEDVRYVISTFYCLCGRHIQ